MAYGRVNVGGGGYQEGDVVNAYTTDITPYSTLALEKQVELGNSDSSTNAGVVAVDYSGNVYCTYSSTTVKYDTNLTKIWQVNSSILPQTGTGYYINKSGYLSVFPDSYRNGSSFYNPTGESLSITIPTGYFGLVIGDDNLIYAVKKGSSDTMITQIVCFSLENTSEPVASYTIVESSCEMRREQHAFQWLEGCVVYKTRRKVTSSDSDYGYSIKRWNSSISGEPLIKTLTQDQYNGYSFGCNDKLTNSIILQEQEGVSVEDGYTRITENFAFMREYDWFRFASARCFYQLTCARDGTTGNFHTFVSIDGFASQDSSRVMLEYESSNNAAQYSDFSPTCAYLCTKDTQSPWTLRLYKFHYTAGYKINEVNK